MESSNKLYYPQGCETILIKKRIDFLTWWPKFRLWFYLLLGRVLHHFEPWKPVDGVIPIFTQGNQNSQISWLRVYLHWRHRKDSDIAALANKLFSQNSSSVFPWTFEMAPVQVTSYRPFMELFKIKVNKRERYSLKILKWKEQIDKSS